MRAVALLAATVLLLLVGPLAGPARAAPDGPRPTAGPLRLDVEELGPRVVTADGPAVLSIVGTLTNTGAEPVSELGVRVQRGEALGTEGEIRDALSGVAGADAAVPAFVEVPGTLAPGASTPVRASVPLRDAEGLALSRPGVYELLLNVNGTPEGGSRARLTAVRMLLPVLSLPPSPDTAPSPDTTDTTAAPSAAAAIPFTLLYPVTDEPRRLATVPGEQTLLTDDELATSLAPGGRLHGLVTALAERAPTGSRARGGICLVLDADLVATAAAMREGYSVRTFPGEPVPGTGADAARRWLDLLATTARDGCVLALPFADADLVALTRGGLGDLADRAVIDGRTLLAETLGVPVLADTTWPAEGVLDERTLARLAPLGRAVVLSADGVEPGASDRITGVLPVAGAQRPQLAVLTDPLLTRAADGPAPGGRFDAAQPLAAVTPAGSGAGGSRALSTQDVIGALAFRARTLTGGTDPLVLAPPHGWTAQRSSAAALLTAVDQLVGAGLLTPRPLSQSTDSGIPATGARSLAYPLRAGAREIPPDVVDTVAASRARLLDLRSAAVEQGGVGVGVDQVFGPLDRGLVRAASAARRERPETAERVAATQAARVQELRAAVRVLEPPSPYALGSTDAPLLLTVANGLPIGVRVRIELASSGGLRVAPIPEQVVPPLGRRQVQVTAEVTRSGQFVVVAHVRTPDGAQLGPPSRLRVRSTAYGTITVWLTGTAGVLLVVLAARRVVRRVRAETPDPNRLPAPSHATTRLPIVAPQRRRPGPPPRRRPAAPRVPSHRR